MRSHQLLLTSALLSQAIDSSFAFQIPQRNIIAGASSSSSSSFRTRKTKSSSRSATRDNGLITKLIPTLRKSSSISSKKSKSKSHPRKKREDDDTVKSLSNKQILALATTCCVTCLLRPTTARAAAAIGSSTIAVVDPMMITYDMMQVSNLGRMPPTTNTPLTVMPGMYTLFYNALRRYSPLVLASSLLVVTAFVKSVVDGLSYWKTLSDEFENDDSAIIEEFYQVKPMDYVQYSHVLLSSSDDDDQIKQETKTTTTNQEIPTSFSSSRSSSSSQVVDSTNVELNDLVQKSQEYEEDIQESLTKKIERKRGG